MAVQFSFPEYLFLYAFLAIVCSVIIVPIAIRFSLFVGLIDVPGKFSHKVHTNPTPMAGGTVIFLSVAILYFALGLWEDDFLRALITAAGVVYLFGLWDDIRGLSAFPKLVGQILAGVLLITSDVSIHFVESIQIPSLSREMTSWIDTGLTLFWLIGVTNAMNMIDSMDGLAVGLSGVTFLFFIPVALLSGQTNLAVVSVILLGISVGLYFFNITPAKLFLGDSGAQTLGFLIAAIAMAYAPVGLSPISSWFVPILLVSLPIFDTTMVVYSRLRHHAPIYKANLDHTYHRLVEHGLDGRRAVLAIHMTAAILDLVAFITFFLSPLVANVVFGAIIILGVAAVFVLER